MRRADDFVPPVSALMLEFILVKSMIAVLLASTVAMTLEPFDTSSLARRYERLSRTLASYAMTSDMLVGREGPLRKTVMTRVWVDGRKWSQETLHCTNDPDAKTARASDQILNTVFAGPDKSFMLWDNMRQLEVMRTSYRPWTELKLLGIVDKNFLLWEPRREYLDQPLALVAPDGKSYRCRWRDIALPEAFQEPGWRRYGPESQHLGDGGTLRIERTIGRDFVDRIDLDPEHGYCLKGRSFLFAEGAMSFAYDDPLAVGDDLWIAGSCSWRRDDTAYKQVATSLVLGSPPAGVFEPVVLPGTIIADSIAGTTRTVPGGEDLLDEMIARDRVAFHLPRAPLDRFRWRSSIPALALSAGAIALLALGASRAGRRSQRRVIGAAAGRRGITLIEVLVVIAVIGLLVALLLPAVAAARRAAARMQCQSHLREIGIAVHSHIAARNVLPTGRPSIVGPPAYESFGPSAFVSILPYLDSASLYNSYNINLAARAVDNSTAEYGRPATLVCPADPASAGLISGGPNSRGPWPDPPFGTWPVALTNYAFMYGTLFYSWESRPDPSYDPLGQINGCFNDIQVLRPADVTDGLSQTSFATERALSYFNGSRATPVGRWTDSEGWSTLAFATMPPNLIFQQNPAIYYKINGYVNSASSFHAGGVNILLGDGSVRFVKDTISSWPISPDGGPIGLIQISDGFANVPPPGLWQILTTRGKGEPVGEF